MFYYPDTFKTACKAELCIKLLPKNFVLLNAKFFYFSKFQEHSKCTGSFKA